MVTVNTAYNPYKGMVLRYVVIIWKEGNSLKVSAEKIYENSSTVSAQESAPVFHPVAAPD